MNFWIFVVTAHSVNGETWTADQVLQQRMQDKFWGLGERTPNRRSIQKGDQVVFYVGLPRKVFAASATILKASFQLSEEEKERLSHGTKFFRADYGVLLENVQMWEQPRPAEELVPKLSFVKNKEFWFASLQGGVRQISEQDYRTICEGSKPGTPAADLESESEFALESHLEEFMDVNWDNIDFGSTLARYKAEDDQSGRQFPAGPWSIDFLCIDKDTRDLVVIELKRGKSSDSTVGQVLRYISWVKENIASPGQKVRGIIVAKVVDDALRYAVKGLQMVDVLTYKVDFKLFPFNK
jgi:hypothetical protein